MKCNNIFLSIPVQGIRVKENIYLHIVKEISRYGHFVNNTVMLPPKYEDTHKFDPREVYSVLIKQLHDANFFIAEISSPSLGVGFEIASAIFYRKPVLLLYDVSLESKVSLMIKGIDPAFAEIKSYQIEEDITLILKRFLRNE